MNTGIVSKGDNLKGKDFAFIKVEGQGDVFFHRSGSPETFDGLEDGNKVTFETTVDEKGRTNAVNVQKVA